jgi:hypothetical protein
LIRWDLKGPKQLPQFVFLTDSNSNNADESPVTIGPNGEIFTITNGLLYGVY